MKKDEKMIEMRVRFWTNVGRRGKLIPRHAWSSGAVTMKQNDLHSITPRRTRMFHSFAELSKVIEDVLIEHKITLLPTGREKKYRKR